MIEKQKFSFNPKRTDSPLNENNSPVNVSPQINTIDGKSNQPKSAFLFKTILRSRMRPNKKNDYSLENIDSLETSILHNGLLQNILVIYSIEEDIYIIEAGHRRTQAIDNLIKKWDNYSGTTESEDYEEYQLYLKNVAPFKLGYPCVIADSLSENIEYDYPEETPLDQVPDAVIDSEIRLIVSNEDSRDKTPALRAKHIERLNILYNRKNLNRSKNEKINVNVTIAEQLNISPSQVKNYKALAKLIPELKSAFEKNQITLKEASNYAKLPPAEQNSILEMLDSGQKISSSEISLLIKEKSRLATDVSEMENEIRMIEENQPEMDSADSSVLLEKNKQIEKLRNELRTLKNQKVIIKKPFNHTQALIAKNELAVKSTFESCKKEIRILLESIDSYQESITANPNEDVSEMGILTNNEILAMIGQLKDMLILKAEE